MSTEQDESDAAAKADTASAAEIIAAGGTPDSNTNCFQGVHRRAATPAHRNISEDADQPD